MSATGAKGQRPPAAWPTASATLGGPRWSEESVEAIKADIDAYLAPPLIGVAHGRRVATAHQAWALLGLPTAPSQRKAA